MYMCARVRVYACMYCYLNGAPLVCPFLCQYDT